MQYTKNFTELGKNDAPIAGGKGASLGEMTQAGIPVPGGYVVLADTFDIFLKETDLVQEIDAILDGVNHEAIHTVEKASEDIQGLILSRPMPEAMQEEIQEKFQALGSQYVAVRSSATAEDGADHAWAGQLDSFLNTTENDLIEKVRRCWASLFTPRAIFYRFEKGLHTTHISVAVVVQSMVNSEKSGIAFSVHPVTEDYNQLIIEAGFGLGEAIVSGSVTPDSYVVEKSPRNIIDINVSHQGRALYRSDEVATEGAEQGRSRNEWRELSESLGNSQVLTETDIQELSDIIVRIENHYGFPCDIEWAAAFEKSEGSELVEEQKLKFYIVQSRPITTLSKNEVFQEQNEPENHLAFIKSVDWQADWEGDFPIFPLALGIPAYFEKMQKIFGVSIQHFLTIHKGEITTGYLPTKEYELFGQSVAKMALDRNYLNNWIAKFKGSADRVTGLLNEGVGVFLQRFEELKDAYDEYGAYQIATKAAYNFLPLSAEEERGILEEARKYSETFYHDSTVMIENVARYIAQKHNYETRAIMSLDRQDIARYLEDQTLPLQSELLLRWEKSVALWTNEKEVILGASEVDELVAYWDSKIETENLKGEIAYPGKVRGICKIVTNFKEASLEGGEILVTGMTDPNFVPLMKIAGAIITDSGGLLCHAAIVARELKIPCIIGTKAATRVLKDGDLVEVDADNGVVRIIESGNCQKDIPLTRENTVFTFESTGTTFLFEDIVSHHYIQWECIRIAKADNVRVFVKKEEVARMNEEGSKMTRAFLEEKVRLMQEQSRYMDDYIAELRTKESLTKNELEEFFQPLEVICDNYSFFDIHYSDGMVTSDGFSQAGEYVQSVKNILRDVLGKPFFTDDGWMKIGLSVLSKQFSVPEEVLQWYTKKDIENLLEDKRVSDEILASRKLASVLYRDKAGDRSVTMIGEDALRIFESFEEKDIDKERVQGAVAHKGMGTIRGKVRLVKKDFSDPSFLLRVAEEFEEGSVLVTDTTDPDFLPIMKKSGAIVTDVGGMLSHASITSRELNKLCVVGTVSATKVFKDGDLVEVDADNGIVRILEQKDKTIFSSIDGYTKFGRWVAPTIEVELWLDWSHTPEAKKLGVPYNPNPDVVSLDGHFFVRNTGAYPYIQERILSEFRTGETMYADAILDVAQELAEKCTERALQEGTHDSIEEFVNDFDLMSRLRFPWWACFALSDAADTMIAEYAKNKNISIDDITAVLPQLPSSLTRDQEVLLNLKREILDLDLSFDLTVIEKNSPVLAEKLYSYQKQTEYLGTHHFWGEARKMSVFLEALQKADSVEEHEAEHDYAEIKHVLRVAGRGAQLRLECAQSGARLAYAWRPFLTMLAERVGLTYDEIIFLTSDEIKGVHATSRVDVAMVRERIKKAGLYKTDEVVKVLWGQELEAHLKQFVPIEVIEDVSEIKGNIANKGKVQGRVAIVLTPKDAERVEKGMILVAPETTPDFIPAMGRAAAFVTDRGGITSHAAIVAREMKKPCVIGTKVATQVLKDGDLVEVDADNGVVRIIEKVEEKKLTYTETLERDTTLVMQGAFVEVMEQYLKEIFGIDPFKGPAYFYILKNENIVFCENPDFAKELLRQIEENSREASFLSELKLRYEASSQKILPFWKKKKAETLDELRLYLEEAKDFILSVSIAYYGGSVENLSEEAKNLFLRIRSEYDFFATADEYVRDSLEALGVRRHLANLVAPSEMQALPTNEALEQRKEKGGIFAQGKVIEFKMGQEIQDVFPEYSFLKPEMPIDVDTITGQVAQAGKAIGLVRIVKNRDNAAQTQEGEIIVSPMTTPDFLPAMKKALAFVTDEGGITCHAAIVAREMKKPCIIGTKIATKVLKDGDLVEVDAESGVVRILSQDNEQEVSHEDKEVEWEHYLTRSFTLFQVSLWHMWYASSHAEEVFGERAYEALYCQTSIEEVEHMRPVGQVALWKKKLVSVYENNPEQLTSYLQQGFEYNERFVAREITFHTLEEAVEFSLGMAMHATIIPLLVGEYILERETENSPLYQDVITLRSRSYYGDIISQYIIPLAKKKLENRGIDGDLLPFLAYEELDSITEEELLKRKERQDEGRCFIYSCNEEEKQLSYKEKVRLPEAIATVNDWGFYLERQQPLFVFAAFAETYGKLLEEATGFGYKHQLHFFKEGLGIFYRSHQEMQKALRYFAMLLDNEDSRIDMWLKKEQEIFAKLESYESLEDLEAILDAYLVATLYNPTINYRLQASTEYTEKPVSKEIKKQLEVTRSRSFYPYFIDRIMPRFFASVAQKMGVEHSLATLLTPEELRSVIAGKGRPTKDELLKRQAGCYFYLDDSGSIEFYYDSIQELEKSVEVPQELKGSVAFRGKITGEVCVINNTAQMEKMKEGSVLVSINTNPSLMSAIQKAGAIVTDEGGITCHAAIISRELKKPCIIGTKIATKVLKDGDLVEVDAESGVVKVIKRV